MGFLPLGKVLKNIEVEGSSNMPTARTQTTTMNQLLLLETKDEKHTKIAEEKNKQTIVNRKGKQLMQFIYSFSLFFIRFIRFAQFIHRV